LVPSRYTRGRDFAAVAGLYVLAKIVEALDRPIFELGHIVSGHTLTHLAAAGASYWILRMLRKRRSRTLFHGDSRGLRRRDGSANSLREIRRVISGFGGIIDP